MAEKRGMGRGLSAILSVTAEDVAGTGGTAPDGDELRELKVAEVHPNPHQPRKRFDERRIALLLEMAWWDWPAGRLRAAIPLLTSGEIEALHSFWLSCHET